MSTLSSLKLVPALKFSKPSDLVQRRHKLSSKLWEQLQLAQTGKAAEADTVPVKEPDLAFDFALGTNRLLKHWALVDLRFIRW